MKEKDPGTAPDPALSEDLDRGLRFVHGHGMHTRRELLDVASGLQALVEELAARGQLDLSALAARRAEIAAHERQRLQQGPTVEVGESVDKYGLKDLPDIPCAELIPLCKARCCRFHFALSFQDLDEGVARWDYERPYQIRRKADGYCHHHGPGGACQVYAHRPAVCRRYDCRGDKRIWLDYEQRIPAPDEDRPITVG